MKLSVAILISGSGSNMVQLIKSMDNNHPAFPSIVISNKPNAAGIKKAKDLGIPTQIIDDNFEKSNGLDFESKLKELLNRYEVKIICLAGFMRILTEKITKNFYGKIINIHPSLLPKYPGLNTHKKVLENKDKEHGATVHLVDEGLDSGPIIGYAKVKVDVKEKENDLINKFIK